MRGPGRRRGRGASRCGAAGGRAAREGGRGGASGADAGEKGGGATPAGNEGAGGSGHATVFPAPLTTIAAALVGGFLGLAAVYGVAERLADTLAGVAAVVMIFAVTLAGPRVHAGARSEVGRTVAVVLQSVGFGGVLGALLIRDRRD